MTTGSDTHWAGDRLRAVPGARTLSDHRRPWLVKDLVADATLPPPWIVVAAAPMTGVDTTAADVLNDLDVGFKVRHVHLVFAGIERNRLTRTIDPAHFCPTVETAVAAFRRRTGVEWAAGASTQALGEG
ncbi:hypothetical protein [Streptomyces gilvus]|uniref:hypothetical protein n=1 Tax=Streptomyces gilvus TaxID=2920937 RepID=UPI001F0DFC3F|nr:hypothetical protein [Streptomyces sp. CME 23]MCH5672075.1 hypothetical protein [Streptomyces sp. CME 23]